MLARATIALILSLLLAPVRAAELHLPLQDYFAGLRTVQAKLAGRDLRLLFDTGGGGVLLSPEAISGHCQPFGQMVGFRFNGDKIAVPRCTPVALSLSKFQKTGEVAVFDVMALLGNAPKVDGILGLSALEQKPFVIDNEQQQLRLMDRRTFDRWVQKQGLSEIRIRIGRQAGGAALDVFVAVDASPGPLWLEFDSGNTGPVLLAPHALKQLQKTLGESPESMTFTVPGLPTFTATAVMRETIYDGLLNADVVNRHVWAMDLERGRAYARPIRQIEAQ